MKGYLVILLHLIAFAVIISIHFEQLEHFRRKLSTTVQVNSVPCVEKGGGAVLASLVQNLFRNPIQVLRGTQSLIYLTFSFWQFAALLKMQEFFLSQFLYLDPFLFTSDRHQFLHFIQGTCSIW